MKKLTTFFFVLFTNISYSQGVGINETGSAPDESAILHVESESGTKGVLLTRMTTTQRDAIVNPAHGLTIFNIETSCYNLFDGLVWRSVCGATEPPALAEEKPRVLGYGGGLGNASRSFARTGFQDVDVRVLFGQSFVALYVDYLNHNPQYRLIYIEDWTEVTHVSSVVVLDGYIYALLSSTSANQNRVFRYDLYDLSEGPTEMIFVGLPIGAVAQNFSMTTNINGQFFYFAHNAGNSADDFAVAKYTILGNQFQYVGTTFFGNIPGSLSRIIVDSDDNVFGFESTPGISSVRKFDPNGNLLYQFGNFVFTTNSHRVLNWSGTYYVGNSQTDFFLNRVFFE